MEKLRSKSYYHWVILVCAIMLTFCNIGGQTVFTNGVALVRDQFALSYSEYAYLATIKSITMTIALLFTGKLIDKWGIRLLCIIAFVFAVIAAFVFSVSDNFIGLVIAYTLMGIANGWGSTMPAQVLLKHWFVKKRGLAISIGVLGGSLTPVLLSAPFAFWISQLGFSASCRIIMIGLAVIGVIVTILIRDKPEDKSLLPYGEDDVEDEKESKRQSHMVSIVKPLSKLAQVMLYIVVFLIGVEVWCGVGSTFVVAASGVGYSKVFVAGLVSVSTLCAALGKLGYGLLDDRFGTVFTNYIYFILLIVGHFSLAFMDGNSLLFPYIGAVLGGFAMTSFTMVAYPLWVSELSSDDGNFTKMLKNMQSIAAAAGIVCTPIAGIIADYVGGYGPVNMSIAIMMIIAMIIIQNIYHRYCGKSDLSETAI